MFRRTTNKKDELYKAVLEFVINERVVSIKNITEEFQIGFNRAQMIVETLEKEGIVSASAGTKARKVLVKPGEMEIE